MSEFDNDLYGDLDLEDLDATQLDEELVDPDQEAHADEEPSRDAPSHESKPDYGSHQDSHAPPASHQGGGDSGPSGSNGYFENRMRPSDMPDEGKMFIGGLNWETTDDGLRSYFSQYGDIENCTIMRDPTGRSRGFAFLTFKSVSSVEAVLAKDHQLDGKMIDPKRAIPRAEHERTAKVFVGGLAPSVTSESLKHFLSQYGKVMDATVMFDRLNGRSKGFAFATFADESGVEKAMQNSGVELEGRQIEIKKAQPRGAGTQVKTFNAPGGARTTGFNPTSGMGMGGAGGFDPSAMAMMYQNMMKGGMGMNAGGGGGFDPSAMAVMYQNMMKNMGMNQAPAINPNMAQRGMGGMGMMGGMMNPMMMGMNPMMGMGGMMGGASMMGGSSDGNSGGMGRGRGPNAPRGPSAMRGGGPSGMAQPMAQNSSNHGGSGNGSGPQRYSTQGSQRAKPY